MFLLDRLLKLKDMGGRRYQRDRRKKVLELEFVDRRNGGNRRSGFDRREMMNCLIVNARERREAFRDLPN